MQNQVVQQQNSKKVLNFLAIFFDEEMYGKGQIKIREIESIQVLSLPEFQQKIAQYTAEYQDITNLFLIIKQNNIISQVKPFITKLLEITKTLKIYGEIPDLITRTNDEIDLDISFPVNFSNIKFVFFTHHDRYLLRILRQLRQCEKISLTIKKHKDFKQQGRDQLTFQESLKKELGIIDNLTELAILDEEQVLSSKLQEQEWFHFVNGLDFSQQKHFNSLKINWECPVLKQFIQFLNTCTGLEKFEYIGDIQNDEAQEKLFSKGIEKLINLKELNIAKVSFNMNKIYQLYEKTSCFIEKSISQLEYLSILKFKYERIGEREIKQLFKSIKQSQSQLKLLKIEAESFVGNKQLDETHFLGFESLQKIEDFGFFIYKQNLGKGVLSRDALFKILDSLNNLKNIQICELKVSYAEDIDEEIMDKIIQILNQKDRKLKKLGLLFSKYTIQSLKLFAEKFININKNVKFEIFYDEFNFDEEPIELNIFNQQVSTLCQAKTRNIQIIQLLQEMNIRDKKWVPDIARQFSKKLDYFPQQIQQMQQQKQQQQINNNNVNINQQMQQQEFQELQQQQQQQQQQLQQQQQQQLQQQQNANFNNMNNFQPQLNGNQLQQQQQQQQQQYQQQLLFQQYQFQQQQMQQQQLEQMQFLNNMNNNMQLNNYQNQNIQNQQMNINNNQIDNQQQHIQQINNNLYNNNQNNFYFQNNGQQQNLDSSESFNSDENSNSNSDEEIKQKSSSSNNNGNNSAEETKSQQIMNNYQQQIQKQLKIDQHKQQINEIQKQQQQQQKQQEQQYQETLINHDSEN